MFKLAVSDFFSRIWMWLGALVVAVTCGLIIQYGLCIRGSAEQAGHMFGSVGFSLLLFTGMATVPVVTAVGGSVVARQRRSYAMWQLVGVLPGVVRNVVLLQLCMAGAIGATVGAVVASLLYLPTLPVLLPEMLQLSGLESLAGLYPSWPKVIDSALISVALFVLGGLGPARRAAKTSPIAALSELERPVSRRPWLRIIALVLCLVTLGLLFTWMRSGDVAPVTNGTFYFTLVTVALFSVLAPWVLPGCLRLWSAPLGRFVLPDLARRGAEHALASSASIELPITIGFGMLAGFYSMAIPLGEWYAAHSLSFDAMLNQTAQVALFGCPIAICLVGSMASALVSSGEHSRSTASLILVGMTPREALGMSLWESLMHAVNALLVGILTVLVSSTCICLALGVFPTGGAGLLTGLPVVIAGLFFVGLVLCISTLHGIVAATTCVGDAARGDVDI